MKPRVLVVDDDRQRGEMVSVVLAEGYECQGAFTLDEAFATVGRSEWEAAMVDYDLGPQGSGLELLQALREFSPRTLRVLYSEHYCNGLARDASRLAAAHAVVDARLPDFLLTLHDTLDRLLLLPSPGAPGPLRAPELDEPVWFTVSAASQEFLRALRATAESESAVFVYGEQGSGKNLAASLFQTVRADWRGQKGRPGAPRAAVAPVVILAIPPLRERIEDIPALAQHCLERHARQSREPVRHLTNEGLDDLLRRSWWGNVRELHGVLIRACQRAGSRLGLSAADLPHDAEPRFQPSQFAKDEGQRDCVLRQLRTAGNVSGAARLEGITRTNYIRLMRRLGVLRADTAPAGEPDSAEAGQPG